MKELINTLQEIDNDFYKGIYTAGERYDLIEGINQLLKNKQFIQVYIFYFKKKYIFVKHLIIKIIYIMKLYFLYSEKELKKELYTNAKDRKIITEELHRRIKKKSIAYV